MVKVLCEGKTNLHPQVTYPYSAEATSSIMFVHIHLVLQTDVIYFREERNNIVVEVALRW